MDSSVPLAKQLFETFDKAGYAETLCLSETRIQDALAKASARQERIYDQLADKTAEVLEKLKGEGRQGIVLAGHPYHVDAGLSHGVDLLLNSLGFAVLSASGLLALARRTGKLSSVPDGLVAATWTQPSALYALAKLVAEDESLELVQLYSFGCGVDALSTGQVREIIEASGKLYTALKMDEMVDLAAIRIRLRSLAVAINERSKETEGDGSCVLPVGKTHEPSPSVSPSCAPVILMPALAPDFLAEIRAVVEEVGYQFEVLDELTVSDVESGLRSLSNDLCYPMIAIAGQVIEALPRYANAESLTVIIPQVCCGCRSIELEQIIRGQLKNVNYDSNIRVIGIPSRNELFTMPAWLATRIYDVLSQHEAGGAETRGPFPCLPLVGVIGNAGLLYTPQLNNNLLEQIRAESCVPHTPPITELLRTNAPLEHCLEGFINEGIYDIIFIQSFGCLTGHINGRGTLKRLKKRYPQVNISFIDFDSGASEVNQSSRLKLALTIAKERAESKQGNC